MGRWQPGTRDRLQGVALELFAREGYEATTVADIAERAQVTERTFYRYFADKREVLFDGQERLTGLFVEAVRRAPADAAPLVLATAALAELDEFFSDERRSWSRRRQVTIEADPALRERELLKLASLSAAVAAALRDRGVPEPAAGLSADTAVAVFRSAFGQWIAEGETRSFGELQVAALAALRSLTVD